MSIDAAAVDNAWQIDKTMILRRPADVAAAIVSLFVMYFPPRRGGSLLQLQPSRAAERATISARRALWGAIRSCINASTSDGAVSGEPALKGGAGLYSSRNWIAWAVFSST